PVIGERTEWSAYAGSFGALKLRLGDLRRAGGLEIGTGAFASRSDGGFSYTLETPEGSGHVTEQRRTNAGQEVIGGATRGAIERRGGGAAALLFADVRRPGVRGTARAPTRFATLDPGRVVAGLEASMRPSATGAVRGPAWARHEGSALDDPRG